MKKQEKMRLIKSRLPGKLLGRGPSSRKTPGSPPRSLPERRLYFIPLLSLLLFFTLGLNLFARQKDSDTWANWQARLDEAYEHIPSRKIPGRTMGILVPSDTRTDLLPMGAFGYETLGRENVETVVYILQAPDDFPLNGLAVPDLDAFETNVGRFEVDNVFIGRLLASGMPVSIENDYFAPETPKVLESQLAQLRYQIRGRITRARVAPILVKFSDVNVQAKDYAPLIAELIKKLGMEKSITFVIVGDLSRSTSEEKLIQTDFTWLTSIRTLDVDGIISIQKSTSTLSDVRTPDMDAAVLGLLTLRCLGADHTEILAYAHSGQMILTKDKSKPISYAAAAIASGAPIASKIPHVKREKLVDIFDELLRADMLAMTRQACASILDPTAAKPPSLVNREGARPWPVYVSLYDPDGNLAGQAGSYLAIGPLEESIRQYAFDAVQRARPNLSKENFGKYVVDVTIPYGFNKVDKPEAILPFLNGSIVHFNHKTSAWHPDAWRTYPDIHQMLGAMCTRLSARPWTYATDQARVESFRVLSFNEKEPFQDLNAAARKKKKKPAATEENLDTGGDLGGGGLPF